MELTREESKRILRRIELEAYSALVTALRAQGELDRQKKRLLRDLGEQLSISTERHRAEIRRAISDDRLSMIAECVCGSDASVEWESEGRRVVPLMPRLVPQTAFTGAATAAANHAASVNSTIPSTTKGRTMVKDDDEEFKSRKRQRTSSPGTIQKVIVSSTPKTSTSTATVRNNNTMAKDSSRFLKTTTLPVKQENTQLSSSVTMKMTSSQAGSSGVSSKPIILGGTKSSSVSVAPSKYVAPLPASCLQAHASVVSGNKNRMNVNVVKTKPKPKFKSLAPSVKIKPASSVLGTSVASSVTQTAAQSVLSPASLKGSDVASSTTKTVQVSRSTSSITVAPRSSISLTAFKTTIQPKPNTQSSPGTTRNVESISRPSAGQLGKSVSVSRLSRPLPAILPKTIPPKSLTTVSSPGRKLASILPAPAKSTSSTLASPLIVPVVVSSATTSTPIPIAPSPRPPQSFTARFTSSVVSKANTVSSSSTQGVDAKRDVQETSTVPKSPASHGKSPAGSQDSSPMSSKSLDNIHEREALSPVNEILTLVTSPSSVPFVPSSPVKSKPTSVTLDEISLECDENLLEDLIKDDEIQWKKIGSLGQNPATFFPQTLGKTGSEERKDVSCSSTVVQALKNLQDTVTVTRVGHSLQEANKSNSEISQVLEDTSVCFNESSVSKPIDLSPLVDELISSSSFDKQFGESLDGSNLLQTNTASGDNSSDISGGDSVDNLFVGQFPVLALDTNLGNVSETTKCDVGDVDGKEEETVNKQLNPVINTKSDVLHKQMTATGEQEDVVDSRNKRKQNEFSEMKKGVSQAKDMTSEQAKLAPDIEKEAVEKGFGEGKTKDLAKAKQNDGSNETGRLSDDNVGTTRRVDTLDEQTLDNSKEEGKALTGQEKSNILHTDTTIQISGARVVSANNNEPSSCVSNSSESKESTQDKRQSLILASNVRHENKNTEDNVDTTHQAKAEANEVIKSNVREKEGEMNVEESMNKDISNATAPEAEKSCMNTTDVLGGTQEHSIQEDGGRQENIEEQLSGSEASSLEGNLVRTSNRKRKAPPPRDLSLHPPGWVRSALQLLQKVSRFRGSSRAKNARSAASWFLKPVETSEAPGYHKVIKIPMDFGTIKTKLEAGEYGAPADFHRDMLLVKSNCCKYNPPGHVVRKDCDEVFQFYEAEYERFVEKLDKIYLSTPKKQKASPI